MSFQEVVEVAGQVVEGLGVSILVVGSVAVVATLLYRLALRSEASSTYRRSRQALGKVLLLGIEVLVAGDIIATVAVEPSLHSVGVLAGIVAIRTFLSWSIEMETEGRWPWSAASAARSPVGGETRG